MFKLLSLFAILCFSLSAVAQDLLQGNLEKGLYEVGFKRKVVLDSTRNCTQVKSVEQRPVIINMWYPSVKSQLEPFAYGRYLNFDKIEIHAELKRKLARYNRRRVKTYCFDNRFILKPYEIRAFHKLKKLKTLAVENAIPINGKFPLVIYHQGLGASIEDNQAYCEYLASHGYVVCNAAYQYEHKRSCSVQWSLKISIPDMDIVIETARNEPFVNKEMLAVMGQSYGAQAAYAYLSKGKYKAKTLISFDSTVDYNVDYNDRGFSPLLKCFWESNQNYNVPILNIAGSSSFKMIDSLIQSPRTYLEVTHLEHNDFISQGITGRRLEMKNTKEKKSFQAIIENYEALAKYTLLYLNQQLKLDTSDNLSLFEQDTGLPSDRLIFSKRAIGENPAARNLFHPDSTILMSYAGIYECKNGKKTSKMKLYLKDGNLYSTSTNILYSSHWRYEFSSNTEFVKIGGALRGVSRKDEKGNHIGFDIMYPRDKTSYYCKKIK